MKIFKIGLAGVCVYLLVKVLTTVYFLDFGGMQYYGSGRFQLFDHQILRDEEAYGVELEADVISHEYKFPYLYVFGVSGYTKLNVLPGFLTDVRLEKVPNMYLQNLIDKEEGDYFFYEFTNVKRYQKAYGNKFIQYRSLNDLDKEDKNEFVKLYQKGKERKEHFLESYHLIMGRKQIFDELDKMMLQAEGDIM